MAERTEEREILHAHMFCGLGSGAKGFNQGQARVGNMVAKFRCVGGIDVDPAGIRDFARMTGVPGTVMDLFSLDQYMAYHGKAPPPGWREALPADISATFTAKPHILFLSAPCKGFSGLLSETNSKTDKYQALNELTLRGMWLFLEAYADDPVELIVFENVPRIATRGRHLLDQIVGMLRHYGYAVAETTHDCGELGGLAQSRKRFLLVARHAEKVPPYLYEPPKKRLRGVGEVLDLMPLPGDPRAGVMHRMPALQWQTWVRLAFVQAGSDWRSLNKLNVENGVLTDFGIVPEPLRNNGLGVIPYDAPAGTVQGESFPTNGRFAVADPRAINEREGSGFMGVRAWEQHAQLVTGNGRPGSGPHSVADPRREYWGAGQVGVTGWDESAALVTGGRSPLQRNGAVADPRVDGHAKSVQLGVRQWDQPAAVIKGDVSVGGGPYAVSDPRVGQDGPRFSNAYRIVAYDEVGRAVTSAHGALAAVADPRPSDREDYKVTKYRVTSYEEAAGTVISASTTGNGGFAVADPRGGPDPDALHGKHRVETWDGPSRAVIAGRENGATAVADPRPTHGPGAHTNKMRVVEYEGAAPVVTGSDRVGSGALSVADPRPHGLNTDGRGTGPDDAVRYVDHYGVLGWLETSKTVSAAAGIDNGRWSVADPREAPVAPAFALPTAKDRLVCVIRALDGTWHRPFTTLELAALQSFFDPAVLFAFLRDPAAPVFDFSLDGKSDSAWRERIGNAVPGDAAAAIASAMARTLLLAWSGETFMLSHDAIWVQQIEVGLSLDQSGQPI